MLTPTLSFLMPRYCSRGEGFALPEINGFNRALASK